MRICGKLNPNVQRTGMRPTAMLPPPISFTYTGSTVCCDTKLRASEKKAPSITLAMKLRRATDASVPSGACAHLSTIDLHLPCQQPESRAHAVLRWLQLNRLA